MNKPKGNIFSVRLMAALAALAAFGVSANTLVNGFVFDDVAAILNNEWIRDPSLIPEILTSTVGGFDADNPVNYYRPFLYLILILDYLIFGLSPWGYHLTNLIFHSLNTVLVFFIALTLLRDLSGAQAGRGDGVYDDYYDYGLQNEKAEANGRAVAFVAALLFAVHPAHTEAVAFVASISELAFSLLFLVSLYIHMRLLPPASGGGLRHGYLFLGISLASFFLSLLCKETAIMLLPVMALYDLGLGYGEGGWAKSRGFIKGAIPRVKSYVPYIIVVAAYVIIKIAVSGGVTPAKKHAYLDSFQYLINTVPLFIDYIKLMVYPVGLKVFYVFHPVFTVVDTRFIIAFIISAFLIALLIIKRRDRVIVFCSLWAILTLLPPLYIPAVGGSGRDSVFAERYAYMPSAGFLLLVTYLIYTAFERFKVRNAGVIFAVVGVLAVAALSYATFERNKVWKEDYTLWKDASLKTGDSVVVFLNLAVSAEDKGLMSEAEAAYMAAIDVDPYSVEVRNNLGIFYSKMGKPLSSAEAFKAALKLTTNQRRLLKISINLGDVYFKAGMAREAAGAYFDAVGYGAVDADIHNRLGIAYAESGNLRGASVEFKRALELDPKHGGAKKNLERLEEILK